MIGYKISRHFLHQAEVKPKPIVTCLHAFFRAWRRLHVFASSSDWFIGLLRLMWLVRVITLVLVLRHSIENCSMASVALELVPFRGENKFEPRNRWHLYMGVPPGIFFSLVKTFAHSYWVELIKLNAPYCFNTVFILAVTLCQMFVVSLSKAKSQSIKRTVRSFLSR